MRRGGALMWSVAALAVAAALAPVFVGLCGALARVSARGAHRLVATQRGTAELERLRLAPARARAFVVPELPAGRGSVDVRPGPPGGRPPTLAEARVTIAWTADGVVSRAEWVTLVRRQP